MYSISCLTSPDESIINSRVYISISSEISRRQRYIIGQYALSEDEIEQGTVNGVLKTDIGKMPLSLNDFM